MAALRIAVFLGPEGLVDPLLEQQGGKLKPFRGA